MRRLTVIAPVMALIGLSLAATLWIRPVRALVKSIVRPEPPAQITPLAITLPATPTAAPIASATPPATRTPRPQPTRAVHPGATPIPTATPAPTPTRGPVEVGGRRYDAYIPAATKPGQFFQYSCEFDAAWVILTTYGFQVGSDELINSVAHDRSIEPYMTETSRGFVIHGGDITRAFAGDYTKNYLARGTSGAFRPLFERYGLRTTPVHDRAALEAALRRGELVWLKTTVDFKPWRPATWVMPDGRTFQTVLGNDHAVVAMGFSERGVVIRDVLGPTSTNRQRPYEYEVPWEVFMAAWGAQSYDGLAVAPPAPDP
ncbi:C39 family peptidase [Kallotenue papyrolyticum]|uniref:C39 family peptidase n=1 Tax=Kallotenue papyrolyticum TaxID=1325125 RepID=UPI000492334F|nr:C39 family peptidase [Kallotenue papyrolyticum]